MIALHIASPWVRLVDEADRRLTGGCLFRDSTRTWHFVGSACEPDGTPVAGFIHRTGRDLASVMTRHPDLAVASPFEEPVCSPQVVSDGKQFHLFFAQGAGRVLHARSADPSRWDTPAEEAFAETAPVAPRIVRVRNLWCMYYAVSADIQGTARSCIVLRTSLHLTQWSPPKVVYADTAEEPDTLAWPTLGRVAGGFVLLASQARPGRARETIVLFSQRHDRFAWGDKAVTSELPDVAVPLLFESLGGLYLARIGDHAVEIAQVQPD